MTMTDSLAEAAPRPAAPAVGLGAGSPTTVSRTTANPEDLTGRVALVTGAARGMGLAHARALARRGADVILADLDAAEAHSEADALRRDFDVRALGCQIDVTSASAAEEIAGLVRDEFDGRLDILVSNAGLMHNWKGIADTPAEDLRPYIDVNVLGPYALVRGLLPMLRASQRGRIVFISSQWGQVPDGHSYGYMISKAAQLGLMKALSKELLDDGILVNAVAPGAVDTRMVPAEAYAEEVAAIPLGRLAAPEEIAEVVAFLTTDAAGFITGQTIPVNGGALIVGI